MPILSSLKEKKQQSTVPILEEDINGTLQFKEDNLMQVLNPTSLENKPIVILSIAGAFRKGKSFFLNLVLRYFRSKGWKTKNRDWLDSWDSSEDSKIHWRPGANGDTRGIVALKDPLIVKQEDGLEIAVILLDTQGNFDHESTRENNVKVFALSTLLSSFMIFNVFKEIQADDFEYLEWFVEFAKEGQLSSTDVDSGNPERGEEKCFQNLLFLVRDWASIIQYPYGYDGGRSYLQAIGSSSNCYQNLRKQFTHTNCYLMPEPGPDIRVPKSLNPHLRSKDLGEDFQQFVADFSDKYLRPDLLPHKRIGTLMNTTAKDIINFIKFCAEKILNGNICDLPSMIQLQAEHIQNTARERELKKFEESMATVLKKMPEPDWEAFEINTFIFQTLAIRNFHENTRFGGNSDSQDLKRDLIGAKTRMEAKMHQKRYEYQLTLTENWYDESIKMIESHPHGFLHTNPEEYEEIYKDCMRRVIQEHEKDEKKVSDVIAKAKEKLRAACNEMKRSAEARNKKVLYIGLGATAVGAAVAAPVVGAAVLVGELGVGLVSGVSAGLVTFAGYFSRKYKNV